MWNPGAPEEEDNDGTFTDLLPSEVRLADSVAIDDVVGQFNGD